MPPSQDDADMAVTSEECSLSPASKASFHILCVDDERLILQAHQAFLSDAGYTVSIASNGQEAMGLFSPGRFDIILLDLRMPGMNGLEVLSAIKERDPEVPVIVVSGTGSIQDVIEALRLGAWDFLTKPVEDLALLEHTIIKCLERSRLLLENRRYRENLEALVQARTQSLQLANQQLQAEIVERLSAEEALKGSLLEKEVLLKEVHHRVKNNLQIISSLLSLQAVKTEDHASSVALHESQNRVRTMALVHEKLYRSKYLASIDFAEYLRDLATFLMQSYSQIDHNVSLRLNCQPLALAVDTAIPCGLLVNELIANCLKHAYPPHAEGILEILLSQEDGMATLTIRDNGKGLPLGINLDDGETLGLQLVSHLTRQLGGSISAESNGGTTFILRFPVKDENRKL